MESVSSGAPTVFDRFPTLCDGLLPEEASGAAVFVGRNSDKCFDGEAPLKRAERVWEPVRAPLAEARV